MTSPRESGSNARPYVIRAATAMVAAALIAGMTSDVVPVVGWRRPVVLLGVPGILIVLWEVTYWLGSISHD